METNRHVIRASSLGHPCMRKTWFSTFREKEEFQPATLLTFDIGTALEPVAIKYLELEGWEVDYNQGSQEADDKISIPVTDNVFLEGHPDAVIWRPETPEDRILIDVKTMNDYAYKQWKKLGTKVKAPQYLEQVHIYGKGKGINKLGIVALNKNKVEFPLLMEVFPFEDEVWDRIMTKARLIASYGECPFPPAINQDIPSWCCNYCGYKRMGMCEGV